MTLSPKNSGWIEVITGSMFSGKTEELIRRMRRAEIAKMNTVLFKPFVDNRYSSKHVVSHNKSKLESVMVKSSDEIIKHSNKMDVIGIDEAQFFDNQIVEVCKKLADKKIRVIVAGLDTDYKGKPFGCMPELMCESDYLDKLRAICVMCGNPASYTQRTISNSKQVLIGETDIYEARCRKCFELPINN